MSQPNGGGHAGSGASDGGPDRDVRRLPLPSSLELPAPGPAFGFARHHDRARSRLGFPEGTTCRPEVAAFAGMTTTEIAEASGLGRLDVVAWRDFDDPEAGGSELHAHRVVSAWTEAGVDVRMTTSSVPGLPAAARRGRYRVERRWGRYAVFPATMLSGAGGRIGSADGLVEIWNGMPFFSPLWARCPSVVFLHHVHAEMWQMVLPPNLARLGYAIEHHLAPPLYRRSRVVTLSASSKREIVERLRLPAGRIDVVPPGIEPQFSPGGERSPVPLVVAVGRLVPVKRFDLLVDELVDLHHDMPDLRATIAGEGYERPALEARIRAAGAEDWISLPGYVTDEELLVLYRRAWVVASASLREGWGMTVTEAGACGTPAVATRIGGHEDAVLDERTGLLVDSPAGLAPALRKVLSDEDLRHRLGRGALERSSRFDWEATARGTLAALGAEAGARRRRGAAGRPRR